MTAGPLPLVVFSHLRWSWVFQRPQHLMSRMAKSRRVLFIEEPVHDPALTQPRWEMEHAEPDVWICRPRSPLAEPGFSDGQIELLTNSLKELVQKQAPGGCVAWLYTPLALPLVRAISPSAIVYDCMDELTGFRGASPKLAERERELFAAADLVFTGGPSLYEAKRSQHPRVYCFPSSVDVEHFATARDAAIEVPAQAALPRPRLGYFGVIDERCDLELLDNIARARPYWQLSMVGPVIKIDPAELPRHANIHYFGQQPYAALPGFLAGWDMCLLPFALNEATRFISPTKTLEYMAAGKPIVSTPIADVAGPYGHVVSIADTPEEFIAACDAALALSSAERRQQAAAMSAVLAKTSWDKTAKQMSELVAAFERPSKRPTDAQTSRAPLVIVGAGPTGLSAAYHAGPDCVLLERESTVGGWCRSIEVNGFTFDYAGHIMFSADPYVHELYETLLGDNVHWQDREAWVYSKDVYTRYPFQGALYGLPAEVIKECLLGAIEARFGTSQQGKPQSNGNGQRVNGKADAASRLNANCAMNGVKDCCADGVLESTTKLGVSASEPPAAVKPANFEEFIYKVWGAGIAKHFAIPYNRKLWAVPLHEMETSWLGGRVPLPDLGEMIDGALRPTPRPMGPNARFGYPLRGGFQALMEGFLPHIQDRLHLNAKVTGLSARRRTVRLSTGQQYEYQRLISTMPLPVLVRMLGDEAPPEIQQAARALRHVSVRCVHIGVGRPNLTEKHWIYYPEDTVFHRVFVQGNASPHCNPPGGFGLTCEITYAPTKPLPCEGDTLTQRCIDDCIRVGLFDKQDPIWATAQVDLPHAYVVYDHARAKNVKLIRDWLLERDIVLAGRYSEWEYYNSDHAFIAGKKAVEAASALARSSANLATARDASAGASPVRTGAAALTRRPVAPARDPQ